MPVQPPAPKHQIEDLGEKLIISIPSSKYWFITAFLGFWLIFWLAGELLILGALILDGTEAPPIAILLIWLVIWTATGGLMVSQFAWQVSGKEVVEVRTQSIKISQVCLGIHPSKEYLASHIKDLRVSSSNMNLNHPMLQWTYFYNLPWYHNMAGSLAFDYGSRTFRFGMSIDEAEAKQIIAEIQQKFPQYRSNGS
jgi:type VI protein secretion system component VasK